jgi:hypothetical protein
MASHLICCEGPIPEDVFRRRFAKAIDAIDAGSTSKLISRISQKIKKEFLWTPETKGRKILWPKAADPNHFQKFRFASRKVREYFDIPIVELEWLASEFLVDASTSVEDVVTLMKDALNLKRIGSPMRKRFEAAVGLAKAHNFAPEPKVADDGSISAASGLPDNNGEPQKA